MGWLNSNFLHNVLNFVIALLGVGEFINFDWTVFGLSDDTSLKVAGALALLKLVINAWRDGPTNMASPQPPVEK